MSEEELADKPPAQGLRKRLLEMALVYYQGFITERRGNPSSQAELVAVQDRLKKILDELTVLEGAGQIILLSDRRVQADVALDDAQRRQIESITKDFAKRRLEALRDFHQLSSPQRRSRFLELSARQRSSHAVYTHSGTVAATGANHPATPRTNGVQPTRSRSTAWPDG